LRARRELLDLNNVTSLTISLEKVRPLLGPSGVSLFVERDGLSLTDCSSSAASLLLLSPGRQWSPPTFLYLMFYLCFPSGINREGLASISQ